MVTFYLYDESGDPVLKSDVASLKLTLYEKSAETIINSRDGQNVLDANNVTMHATSGLVTWSVQPEDLEIQLTTSPDEWHIGLFEVIWASSTKKFQHEVRLNVANLTQYP